MQTENPYAPPEDQAADKSTGKRCELYVPPQIPGLSAWINGIYLFSMLWQSELEVIWQAPMLVLAMFLAVASGFAASEAWDRSSLILALLVHLLTLIFPYYRFGYLVFANWNVPQAELVNLLILLYLIIEGIVVIWLVAELVFDGAKNN